MIEAFGKQWNTTMEGGRRVHPNHPNTVFTDDMVAQNNDGTISLFTEKADIPITTKHWDGKWYVSKYKCGAMYSADAYSYGVFTIKCVLPKGSFQHAAFWLTGHKSWPPEIDGFETYNTKNGFRMAFPDTFRIFQNAYSSELLRWNAMMPATRIQPNIHWTENGNHKSTKVYNVPFNFLDSPFDKVNVYSIEWTPDYIQIYYNDFLVMDCFDKKVLESFNKDHAMRVVMTSNYVPKIQDNEKEEKTTVRKTPFIIKDFTYEPL